MRAQLRPTSALRTEPTTTATAESVDYDKLLLNTKDACAFVKRERGIKLSAATMASLVTRGGGCPFMKFNGQRYYRASSLLRWIDGQCGVERGSSSEAA